MARGLRYEVGSGLTAIDPDVAPLLDGLPTEPIEICRVAQATRRKTWPCPDPWCPPDPTSFWPAERGGFRSVLQARTQDQSRRSSS